jgi:hypothetical protein
MVRVICWVKRFLNNCRNPTARVKGEILMKTKLARWSGSSEDINQ